MRPIFLHLVTCLVFSMTGCSILSHPQSSILQRKEMVYIPEGQFIQGSVQKEREYAYRLDEARGSHASRQYGWFDNETRQTPFLPAFLIDRVPVTHNDYQKFVMATQHPPPVVSKTVWESYGLIHSYDEVKRFLWVQNQPPRDRGQHPVVLVDHHDAKTYCHWLGKRLPSAAEWEKAARGTNGSYFPWGNHFDADRLNSQDSGPYDTEPAGQHPSGASPYGVLDMAGQVFEWTATSCPNDHFIVKGGSWDDFPGVTRAAAWHCRPAPLRHILIGFRCAKDAS